MHNLDKFVYAFLYMLIFGGAVFMFFCFLESTETGNTLVNADTIDKASVTEHIGTEKDALGIDAYVDNHGEVEYVPVKGSDVVYDIVSITNTLSDKEIKNGKIVASIKVRGGAITLNSDELMGIKNRKSSYLKGLDTKIDKNAEYKRIYFYNTDLDIKELKYDL